VEKVLEKVAAATAAAEKLRQVAKPVGSVASDPSISERQETPTAKSKLCPNLLERVCHKFKGLKVG